MVWTAKGWINPKLTLERHGDINLTETMQMARVDGRQEGFDLCKRRVIETIRGQMGDRSAGADMAAHYDAALSASIQKIEELNISGGIHSPEPYGAKPAWKPGDPRCHECDNGVEPDWLCCPYCGAAQSSNDAEFGMKP